MTLVAYVLPALPEAILLAMILLLVMVGAIFREKTKRLIFDLAALSLLAAGVFLYYVPSLRDLTFNGHFMSDSFAIFIKTVIAISGIAVFLNIRANYAFFNIRHFEFAILFLASILGMFVLVSAHDFLTFFVGLELQSLSIYVLLGLHHEEKYVTEAVVKYFILGAVASAFILFGISLLYGYTGTTNFYVFEQILHGGERVSYGLMIGAFLVIAGLGFKMAAVPFHMWSPDVYQGTPYPLLLFFSTAPKIAALAVVMRLFSGPFYYLMEHWQPIVFVISALSMLVGAIAAVLQTSLKRFLAYASISSVGFSLLGLAIATEEGLRSSLFYTTLYIVGIVGFLSCIMVLLRRGYVVEDLSDLKGIASEKPFLSASIAILILSLAGLPPFPGFLGKLFLLQATVSAEYYAIAFVMVLSTVIAAFYYLNVLKLIFFDPSKQGLSSMIPARVGMSYGVIIFSLLVIATVIFVPTYLLNWSGLAAATLFYS